MVWGVGILSHAATRRRKKKAKMNKKGSTAVTVLHITCMSRTNTPSFCRVTLTKVLQEAGKERKKGPAVRDITREREGGGCICPPLRKSSNKSNNACIIAAQLGPGALGTPGRPGTHAAPCVSLFARSGRIFCPPPPEATQPNAPPSPSSTNQHRTQQPGLRCWKMATLSPYVKTNELNSNRAH